MNIEITYDLFVSYADADRSWVEGYLLHALEQAGVSFCSESAFALAVPRLLEAERSIQSSRRILLVCSPAYLADHFGQFVELLAQNYGLESNTWPVIPLLLHPVELPPRLALLTMLDATDPNDWSTVVERLCAEFQQAPPMAAARLRCPYPGMIAFTAEESSYFFGRENEIRELSQRLRYQHLLLVIGPSGSGKSSLVFAGLLPELERQQPGGWLVRSLRPGARPFVAPTQILNDRSLDTLEPETTPARRLLIIDQFEELFTHAAKPEQAAFIAEIVQLSRREDTFLILTMRADFFADLMQSDLWPLDAARRLEIAPLRNTALRDAIRKPAEALGVMFEAGLLEHLLHDAAEEPGVLPLIQETMVLLWDQMERRFLSLRAYTQLGDAGRSGLAVAVARKADASLADLSNEQQIIARRIFLRLVQFGRGRADTRRQQLLSDLRDADEDPTAFDQVVTHLTHNRLLTLDDDQGNPAVDIAHESLIVGWPRLRRWIEEYQRAESTRRRLQERANDWEANQRQGGLLDEVELQVAQRWLALGYARELGIKTQLREFIVTSQAAIRTNKRNIWLRPIAIVAFIALLGVAGWNLQLWHLRQSALDLSPQVHVEGGLATIGTEDIKLHRSSHPSWHPDVLAFELDQYEVTNAQYCLCRQAAGCDKDPNYELVKVTVCDQSIADKPVVYVTLAQADQYCAWIGRRLPTEIEWEWAARGPEARLYPTGNEPPLFAQVDSSDVQTPSLIWPSLDPTDRTPGTNILGMAGSVREWTVSGWKRYLDPTYRQSYWPDGLDETNLVVTRGGSWRSGPDSARSTTRNATQSDTTLDEIGFRCLTGVAVSIFMQDVTGP